MFALRHLLEAIVYILDQALFNLYVVDYRPGSAFPGSSPDPYNPIVRFLYNVTEPVLGWVAPACAHSL